MTRVFLTIKIETRQVNLYHSCNLPVNITIYGVFEDVKYLCFSIITSQVSNHYYVFVS